ncbi:MAG: hypothetical protein KJZ54_05680 [Phycisphaerales bacterium]|nr:hypothetical protein [Phycisphaerales bacterium]
MPGGQAKPESEAERDGPAGRTTVRRGEWAPLVLSCGYFFCVLCGYYCVRSVREAMGVEGGWDRLAWLMTATLAVMFVANPGFAWLVSRFPRRVFIPATYRFFALNMLAFAGLFVVMDEQHRLWLGYAFYVWLSVFNLFVISVFWAYMNDAWSPEQSKRLFGPIGVGGTLGAVCGSLLAARLVKEIGPTGMMLLACGFLEGAVWFARGVRARARDSAVAGPEPGPRVWEGLRLIARSPYLASICVLLLCFTLTSTFLYMEQGRIVSQSVEGRDARASAFAHIDLYANIGTLLVQAFVTSRLVRRLGLGWTLAILPLLTMAGFVALWAAPTLAVLTVFQAVRRSAEYAVGRPAREMLFARLGPDEKYKSKPFIDTFVYRGGDAIGAWVPKLLANAGVAVGFVAIPVAAAWAVVALALGRMERKATPAPIRPQ